MLPKSYLNSYKHFHFESFFSNQGTIVLEYICDSLLSSSSRPVLIIFFFWMLGETIVHVHLCLYYEN